jgi:hydroxyethylthiazole kinase
MIQTMPQPKAEPLKPAPGAELARLRAAAPLVHNITNFVAMSTMANVQLAIGASPAMLHARDEVAEFAPLAAALTINIGTLSQEWLAGMLDAAAAANSADRPWVLDPVAVGATSFRRRAAEQLLALGPRVIRGNASEIIALAQLTGGGDRSAQAGKGVDAADPVEAAEAAANALAQGTGALVAVTGAIDLLTDGHHRAYVANGHPLMPRVTALGCALTGVIGAFLGAGSAPFAGTLAGLAYYGLAGERAAASAAGPGSFASAFLDALAAIEPDQLDEGARISLVD